MRLVVIFTDKPAMMRRRATHETDHLAYLAANKSEILIGGGLRHEPGGKFTGGLWILEVESFERAKELIKNDPYYDPELREWELFVWGKAINEPVVL